MSPPLVGISVSPKRYSHSLIERTGDFTINIPTMDILEKVHVFGTVSGRNVEKFASLGLTAEKARLVRSPIVRECVAHLECRLTESMTTGDHTLFIGEVVTAYADERFFKDGKFDVKVFRAIYHVGGAEYATLSERTTGIGKY
jgi:flavin reductase (DIM6/NTAB) family NADH-FMN oxidoreductase RutF